jgi:ABC-type lipoprotein release transport system permease subunit
MLFGLMPHDAVTFVAAWLPARRAARLDPMRVLRCE